MITSASYEEAAKHFRVKIDSCTNTCPDTLLAYMHIYLGRSLKLGNKYDSALLNFKEGIDRFEKIKHINGLALGHVLLAELYRSLVKHDKAKVHLKIVDSLNVNYGLSLENEALFYSRYAAVIHESTKEYDRVVDYSNKVIELSRILNNKELEAGALNEIGFIYEGKNQQLSAGYYIKAYELYMEMGNTRYAVHLLTNLSRVYNKMQSWEKSLEYAKNGIELSKGKGWYNAMPELYFYRLRAYREMDQQRLALQAYDDYHTSYIKARKADWNKALYEIEAKYDISEKEKQLADIQYAQTLSRIENEEKSRQLKTLILIGLLLLIIIAVLFWTYKRTQKSNLLLSDNIREKEILMQEVHHRVKNNLTFLKSLLYLRSKSTEDDRVKLVLDECQARIQSMALVHQNLYNVEDSSKVDFSLFLEQLFVEIKSFFDQDNIQIFIDAKQKMLEMRLSVFLGLILTELITNSFKYAFDNLANGKVTITLAESDESFDLNYSDSGSGPPPDIDLENSKGFGFKLINILLNQMDAKMTYTASINTFKIALPR